MERWTYYLFGRHTPEPVVRCVCINIGNFPIGARYTSWCVFDGIQSAKWLRPHISKRVRSSYFIIRCYDFSLFHCCCCCRCLSPRKYAVKPFFYVVFGRRRLFYHRRARTSPLFIENSCKMNLFIRIAIFRGLCWDGWRWQVVQDHRANENWKTCSAQLWSSRPFIRRLTFSNIFWAIFVIAQQ